MLARAAAGEAREGDWLIAERQSAGRGRQGRHWQSPAGNFYGSSLVQLRQGDPAAPTLALVAGVALVDALALPGLSLKWPNDLMAGAAKLAGILLERQGDCVVIGTGVNLRAHPDVPGRLTTSLAALGDLRSADAFAGQLSAALAKRIGQWRSGEFASVVAAWLAAAHPADTPLSVTSPDGERIDGRFAGLTSEGALRLRLASGAEHVIHAGDVFLV